MFRGYRFEHPRSEISISVGGWSYLWAGLFGFLYVWRLWRGGFGWLVLRAFAVNLGYLIFYVGVWAATSWVVPLRIQALILLALIPILILSQGSTMLRMLRDAYRHRGWLIRPG